MAKRTVDGCWLITEPISGAKLTHDVGPMAERTKVSMPEMFNSLTSTNSKAQQGLFNQQWQVFTIAIMSMYLQWMNRNHGTKTMARHKRTVFIVKAYGAHIHGLNLVST